MMLALMLFSAQIGAIHIAPSDPVTFGKVEKTLQDQQLDWAMSQVSTNCNVTVNTKERAMYLETDMGKYTVKDAKIIDENGNEMDTPPKALVCLGNKEAPDDGPALMFSASGAKYLMSNIIYVGRSGSKHHQGNPMDFFLNKHCWCKNNNMQYYLSLGNPQDSSGFMSKKDPDALPCKDGKPGNHYFVIAAARQLLMERKNSWIVQMDISDTFFTQAMAHKNLFHKFLDDKYDFIGGATGGGVSIFINGAIVAFKNSDWAKNFAAEWFKNRCGSMNQLAMWHSLFKLWQVEVPEFTWSKDTMSFYEKYPAGGAKYYARHHAGKLLIKDPVEKEALKGWSKNGRLSHSLSFPHVLIHANMGEGGVDGIAYRADMNRTREPFVCHNTLDRDNFPTCNVKQSMCVLPEQCQCD